MRSSYKQLGKYIKQVNIRNKDLSVSLLQGININKEFMPSVANINGTDLSKYKVVSKNCFAYNPMHVGRDEMLPISLLLSHDKVMVSPAYTVFAVIDEEELLPEYLMMWCRRPEFDRNAWFTTDSSVRGGFSWDAFCEMQLPVPSIEKQREIVSEYNVILNRIQHNKQLNKKLDTTVQTIYKQWFEDLKFPDYEHVDFVDSSSTKFSAIPKGWDIITLGMLCSKIGSGSTPRGGKSNYKEFGISLVRSLNVFDYNFSFKNLAFIDEIQAKKLENVQLEKNDILINITGVSVARCCVVPKDILPARVNQHVMIIRPKQEVEIPFYIVCSLCSSDSKARLLGLSDGGSTRQAITKSDIEDFEILLPTEKLRKRFNKNMSCIFRFKNELIVQNQYLNDLLELLLANIASIKVNGLAL